MIRRNTLWAGLAGALCCAAASPVFASDDYPSKPITIILASSPGGAGDQLARLAGEGIQKALGQPVAVISRPGAGGSIGVESVVRAPADGYTFVVTASGNVAINPYVYKLSYDPLQDLAQVTILADLPFVLVANKSFPAKDYKDFVVYAKRRPNEVRMGNAGAGTYQHLTQLMFAKAAGVELNIVPYKGSVPATTDLIGGHIETIIDNVVVQKPFLDAGKLTPLLTTSPTRIASLPNIPTAQELGLPLTAVAWFGLAAPKGTPDRIIHRVQAAIAAAFERPEVKNQLSNAGMTPLASTPEFATQRVRSDAERFGKAVKEFGLKVE